MTINSDEKQNSEQSLLDAFADRSYDTESNILTIKIHRYVLKNPASQVALAERITEIMEQWPSIKEIRAEVRD